MALSMAGLVDGYAGDPPATSFAAEALSLTPGASLEREIRGGETRTFELRLEAGTFLFLEISLRTPDLSFRLKSPRGDVLAEAGGLGPHLLATIGDREGVYRLEAVAAEEQKVATRFSAEILDSRPAASGDEARVHAAKTLVESRRLLASEGMDQKNRAEPLLADSLAAWQQAGDARGEVEALLATAELWTHRGDMLRALAWHEKAAKRSRESSFLEGEARALEGMGICNSLLARHDDAVRFYLEALKIWRQNSGPFEQAVALQELGTIYWRKQDFQSAHQAFEEALVLAAESGDLPQQASALSSVGVINYMQARLGKAQEIWEKALDLSRQAGDVSTEISTEHNLAALYQNQGKFQKALDLFIRVAGRKAPSDAGMTRYNMGNLYLLLGDPDKARENYLLSQAAFHAVGDADNEVNALIGIGRVHQEKGDFRAALAEYLKAQRMVPDPPWIVLHFIGLAHIDMGELQEALESLGRALEMARTSRDRSKEAATLLALGSAYIKLNQPERAFESLGNAIEAGSQIGYQSVVALSLLRRSLLQRDQGQLERALADVENALTVIESNRRNIAGDQLRTGFFAAKRTYYDLDVELLVTLDRREPGRGYRARALEATERARARGLLDLLAEGRIDIRQGLDQDLRQREDDLSDQISRVQLELRAGNVSPEKLQQLTVERGALDKRREQLEIEIQTKNKRYAEVRYPTPLKLDQIQRELLDDNAALLEYVVGERSSFLFVITREEIRVYDLPASAEIEKQVLRLREALEQERLLKRQDYLASAYKLYQELLEPASAALSGKSNLLIVPDGALYYIPFEALLTAPENRPYRDLPYLLRHYSVAYIPSASVLAGLRESRREPSPTDRPQVAAFAPFAGPGDQAVIRDGGHLASADKSASLFKLLPASGREIEGIASLYPGAALSFFGSAADEAAVTSNTAVATARRLHFATHAQIDERHPEYSALVLAERSGEDGLLQMREIFSLKLSADLAVLSACQTARGKKVAGEGLVGLTRAFFYAGVPSLVVSLWNVVDGPTPDLMLEFYKNLDRQPTKVKALQISKLSMIERGTYSHPSYWAPFILLGEPR
jgi:CHAT domain-containing protein/Tfp pilus assembly protein PilF